MKIVCIILVLVGSNLSLHLFKDKTDLVFKETNDTVARSMCGFLDSTIEKRHKRSTLLNGKWHKNNVTWHFDPKNPKFINHTDLIRKHITKALSEWSKYSNLTFTEIVSKDADIVLSFENRTHGDRKFDGNGGILAHSWYPGENLGGDVHFDEDEDWNFDEDGDFYPVTLHELGHSLGLRHSNEETDIMHVSPKKEISSLSRDDIQAIQDIYSKPTTDSQQKHQH